MTDLDSRLRALEDRIAAIEARNARVENEKSWETGLPRKLAILLLTYLVMCVAFYSLGIDRPLRSAIIPTLGFWLSTLSLPLIRKLFTR